MENVELEKLEGIHIEPVGNDCFKIVIDKCIYKEKVLNKEFPLTININKALLSAVVENNNNNGVRSSKLILTADILLNNDGTLFSIAEIK